jgi:Replication initiator protein A
LREESRRKPLLCLGFLTGNLAYLVYLETYNNCPDNFRCWPDMENGLSLLFCLIHELLEPMTTTNSQTIEDLPSPAKLIGRDEMNLAEFPGALLADRAQAGQKTLYFEDEHGRLTVTGSDAYGLPTASDTDVIVALIYLTKLRNNFQDVKVNFSRYELIKLLNWRDEGDSYKRLDQSFNRWGGVWLVYDKCWWDNKTKSYVSAKMHILESVVIADVGGKRRDKQSDLPFSTFTWNNTFIESCQADNLRQLNLDVYFSLKSAVSKRLYRFLGKRFYLQGDWTFDLNEIAFDRVGLSRSYADAGKIKEKLQPAIDELESIGFLHPLSREDRYSRIDRGQWTIRLTRRSPVLAAPKETIPPLVAELTSRGVTKKTAKDLVKRHQAEAIATKIEEFDFLVSKQDKKVSKSPAGYLVKSINDDYAQPKGFTPKAERERQAEAKRKQEEDAAAKRRHQLKQEAKERALTAQVTRHLKSLDAEQLKQVEAEAIAQASEKERQNLDDMTVKSFREMLLSVLVRGHIARLIESGELIPESE